MTLRRLRPRLRGGDRLRGVGVQTTTLKGMCFQEVQGVESQALSTRVKLMSTCTALPRQPRASRGPPPPSLGCWPDPRTAPRTSRALPPPPRDGQPDPLTAPPHPMRRSATQREPPPAPPPPRAAQGAGGQTVGRLQHTDGTLKKRGAREKRKEKREKRKEKREKKEREKERERRRKGERGSARPEGPGRGACTVPYTAESCLEKSCESDLDQHGKI